MTIPSDFLCAVEQRALGLIASGQAVSGTSLVGGHERTIRRALATGSIREARQTLTKDELMTYAPY